MKNKKLIKIVIIVVAIVLVIGLFAGSYNSMVSKQENVETKQSQISVQLQRRADLIPNFVNTVKGYSDYEQSTFTAVTEARSKVKNANSVDEQESASNQLDGAISVWVNAITEAYPELKANENYKALQDELAGTENRVAVARKDYNDAAKDFNTSIRKFPKNIFASLFGFEKYDYFENDESAESVPQVSFD